MVVVSLAIVNWVILVQQTIVASQIATVIGLGHISLPLSSSTVRSALLAIGSIKRIGGQLWLGQLVGGGRAEQSATSAGAIVVWLQRLVAILLMPPPSSRSLQDVRVFVLQPGNGRLLASRGGRWCGGRSVFVQEQISSLKNPDDLKVGGLRLRFSFGFTGLMEKESAPKQRSCETNGDGRKTFYAPRKKKAQRPKLKTRPRLRPHLNGLFGND